MEGEGKTEEKRGNEGRNIAQEPPGRAEPNGDQFGSANRNIIHVISGGPTDGDSRRARKEHLMRIQPGRNLEICTPCQEEDDPIISFYGGEARTLDTPHNDPLVITATIASFDIKRILVDTGSSVDLIFYDCYKKIDQGAELIPVQTALYGFTGEMKPPLGQVSLPLAVGIEPRRVIKMVNFLVVDAASSYNVILGRPSLNNLRAVVSTYYMKMKFPVGEEIGEVVGDQPVARSCYVQSVQTSDKAQKYKPHSSERGIFI